jgi:hypothetical protein
VNDTNNPNGQPSQVGSKDYAAGLVRELSRLPHETEWVEFKVNEAEPQEIGEYISALSNSAAVLGKRVGYLVRGVQMAATPSLAQPLPLAVPRLATRRWRTGYSAC